MACEVNNNKEINSQCAELLVRPTYISRKNEWPLQKARALVIYMCAGQQEWPNIPASTIHHHIDL